MCLFSQLSTRICLVCMKSCSQFCSQFRFKRSTLWLCLTVWCLQTDNLCSMWSSLFLSRFCDLQCIDFNIDLALLNCSIQNCFHILFSFRTLIDLLRLGILQLFINFLQENSRSQLLQSCLWSALIQYHSEDEESDVITSRSSSIFIHRQQRSVFTFIHKQFWWYWSIFHIVDCNFATFHLNHRSIIQKYKNILIKTTSTHLWSYHSVFLCILNLYIVYCSKDYSLKDTQALYILLILQHLSRSAICINSRFEFILCDCHRNKRLWRILINDIDRLSLGMLFWSIIVKVINQCLMWKKFRSRCRSGWSYLWTFNRCCMSWFDMSSFYKNFVK